MEHFFPNEVLECILSPTYVMATPIIIEGNYHFNGYNEDNIRLVLPKEYRRYQP